jgi:DNA-binding Xre family transcriptional regulator
MVDVDNMRLIMSQKKISITELCENIKLSQAGFRRIIKTKNCNVDTLEAICQYLNVSFQSLIEEKAHENMIMESEIKYNVTASKNCNDLLKAKDEIIELLKDKIKIMNDLQKK